MESTTTWPSTTPRTRLAVGSTRTSPRAAVSVMCRTNPGQSRRAFRAAHAAAGRSVRPGEAEDVLGDVAQDQLLADRRDAEQPGLAPVALDVVLLGVAEAAVGLHGLVGGGEGGVGGQPLGQVGLLAARQTLVVAARRPRGSPARRRGAARGPRRAGTRWPGSGRSGGRTRPAPSRRRRPGAGPPCRCRGPRRRPGCAPGSGRRAGGRSRGPPRRRRR